ncbi:hypothetical protein F9C11_28740 [Amycolatopsis sp. VS8301801F10]|uniref:hypothetical protein n=1 Tax=Amycolatopsis sp. VS8301801F10 TaxID=2652442 RepID=UPI0038FCFDA5
MSGSAWTRAPGNAAAERWVTRAGCRTVLVVVPHMTAGTRLAEVLPLLRADHRVQVLFTVPALEDRWDGVEEYVRAWGGLLLPWHQVLRTRFDLAIAASYLGIDKISAPVIVMPHGVSGPRFRRSPLPPELAARQSLAHPRYRLVRDGRVVPAAVLTAHEQDARWLRHECPEAADRVVVAGDLCFDRLRASLPLRDRYRGALDVGSGRKLVLVSSTWSRHSLFGSNPHLLDRLTVQLPSTDYQVVAALHPLTWSMHGSWQIHAWLARALDAGLRLLPPDDGWRAALVAADYVIGDHGSVTQYAAALGTPVLLNPGSAEDVRAGSLAASLWQLAPKLRPDLPADEQLRALAASRPEDWYAGIAARITSLPGRASALLRREMYRVLRIPEPPHEIEVTPVPLPRRAVVEGSAGERP